MTVLLIVRFLLVAAIGYFLGSIPSGLIVGSFFGVNVRQTGSGKTGATNVLRSAGWKAGLIVAAADALKGAVPVLLAQHVIGHGTPLTENAWLAAVAGLGAIIGHTFPIYVGFKGGRGVATMGGMGLALAWPATLLTLLFFIAPIAITRYVSLGSIIGATALPFIFISLQRVTQGHLTGADLATFVALLVGAAIIDVLHRDNIQRIINGTERKLGEKAKPKPTSSHAK